MSTIGSANPVDNTGGSGIEGTGLPHDTAVSDITILGQDEGGGERGADGLAGTGPQTSSTASGVDEEASTASSAVALDGDVGESVVGVTTVTRTTDLTGGGGGAASAGAGEVRTTTRLSTQTGAAAISTPSAGEVVQVGVTISQVSSAPAHSSSIGTAPSELVSSISAVKGSSAALAAPANATSTTAGVETASPSTTDIMRLVTSAPNVAATQQVSTFDLHSGSPVPSASTLIGQGQGQAKTDMDALNMSPMTMSTATNNRASAQSSPAGPVADNLFVPGNRLFPLGITIIVLGGLFLFITAAITLIRLFGWNAKRRIRRAIPSWVDVDPSHKGGRATMFDPDSARRYEKTSTPIASTNPYRDARDSGSSFGGSSGRDIETGSYPTNGGLAIYQQQQQAQTQSQTYVDLSREKAGDGYAAAYGGAYFVPTVPLPALPPNTTQRADPSPTRPPRHFAGEYTRRNQVQNPFEAPPPNPHYARTTTNLDVPVDVSAMGSPVPSFNTGRMGLTAQNGDEAYSRYPTGRPSGPPSSGPGPVDGSEGAVGLGLGIDMHVVNQGRSLTRGHSSRSSTSSNGSNANDHAGPQRPYRPQCQMTQTTQTSVNEVLVIGHPIDPINPFADRSTRSAQPDYVTATRTATRVSKGSIASVGSLGSSVYSSSSSGGEYGDVDWVTPAPSIKRKSYLAGGGSGGAAAGAAGGSRKLGKPAVWRSDRV